MAEPVLNSEIDELERVVGFGTGSPAEMPLVPLNRSPKEQSELDQLERSTGFKAEGKEDKEGLQSLQKQREIEEGTEGFPATRRFFEKPENLTKAQDSVSNLTAIEHMSNAFKRGQEIIKQGRAGTELRRTRSDQSEATIHQLETAIKERGKDPEGFLSFLTSSAEVVGQMAEIKFDAYPDLTVNGHVSLIGTLAKSDDGKGGIKYFAMEITLDGTDKRLRPGMTARSEILVYEEDNAIAVPVDAVFEKGGKKVCYVVKGDSYEMREVVTGMSNENFVLIKERLEEGEKVLLADPARL